MGWKNMPYRKTFKGVLTLCLYHHNLKTHLEKIVVQQFLEKINTKNKTWNADQHFQERQRFLLFTTFYK